MRQSIFLVRCRGEHHNKARTARPCGNKREKLYYSSAPRSFRTSVAGPTCRDAAAAYVAAIDPCLAAAPESTRAGKHEHSLTYQPNECRGRIHKLVGVNHHQS